MIEDNATLFYKLEIGQKFTLWHRDPRNIYTKTGKSKASCHYWYDKRGGDEIMTIASSQPVITIKEA